MSNTQTKKCDWAKRKADASSPAGKCRRICRFLQEKEAAKGLRGESLVIFMMLGKKRQFLGLRFGKWSVDKIGLGAYNNRVRYAEGTIDFCRMRVHAAQMCRKAT